MQMPLSNQEYVNILGAVCPNCYNKDVDGGCLRIDDGVASAEVWCNVCNAVWIDDYKLVGYSDLELPKEEE